MTTKFKFEVKRNVSLTNKSSLMLSIIGIKKTIKQHTADMHITDSVDYKIPYRPNTVIQAV
jgi:hypothetical protein